MLRRLSTSRLVLLVALACAVLGGGTALAAGALGGSDPKPPARPLAVALHDALAAKPVAGVTARITFVNRLIDGSGAGAGRAPLLAGAEGRLWAAPDGRFRLELQSDAGDAQITGDGRTIALYDATTNSGYRVTLPQDAADAGTKDRHGVPTVAAITRFLGRVMGRADLSGARPTTVAGRPAYTVRIAPKHDGGLIGAAELAWDADHGTPLRAAIYAAGAAKPVLELAATDISYGEVDAAALGVGAPRGAKMTTIDLGDAGHRDHGRSHPPVRGTRAVAARLPFGLSAPARLAGRARHGVRLVGSGTNPGALVTYGDGLGGLAVLEQRAKGSLRDGGTAGLPLPEVALAGGGRGVELATALGTVLRFDRGGVRYTVIGSVPPAAAEAAARAL